MGSFDIISIREKPFGNTNRRFFSFFTIDLKQEQTGIPRRFLCEMVHKRKQKQVYWIQCFTWNLSRETTNSRESGAGSFRRHLSICRKNR